MQAHKSKSQERQPLLHQQRENERTRPHNVTGHANGYDEDDDDEDRRDDTRSHGSEAMSHVMLDTTPTFARLLFSHAMALLPCVALLLASVMLAWHAPCHVRQHPSNREEERKTCSKLLSDRVSLATFGIGVICWLAAFAVRPALWKLIELCMRLAFVADLSSGKLTSRAATLLFIVLKTSALEILRLFSVLLANALIFAGLLKMPHLRNDPPLPDAAPWTLHWYDPRFTIAVWLSVGWAMTEFLVSSWQMFDRLSLYELDYDELVKMMHGRDDDEGFTNPSRPRTPHNREQPIASPGNSARSLSDSDPSGEHSDSAATIRARSTIHIPGVPGPEASDGVSAGGIDVSHDRGRKSQYNGKLTVPTPNERLTDARRRVLAAAEESGISIPVSDISDDEAEELGQLRQTLDLEMENLVKARTRVELETAFGQPLTSVPIALCTLWRVDGWLWNFGSTLLMAASVTIAQGQLTGHGVPPLFPSVHTNVWTLATLVALHSLFTALWTLGLPMVGFAFVTYASMLAGVALCIAASARWGLLV